MSHPTRGQTATATARLAAAAAMAALAILAGASGCARAGDPAAPADQPAGLGAGPTPTADVTPDQATADRATADQVGSDGTGGQAAGATEEDQPAEGGPSFPNTATAYADAVITAWQAGDLDRLDQLASAQVYEQIIEIPAVPSQGWTDPWCDGTAGSSYCHQYSQPTPETIGSGQELILRIRHDLLGQPGAAVELSHAELAFDTAWEDYVIEFIGAWHSDDYHRLRQLAAPEVVAYTVTTAPPIHPVLETVGGGGGLLQVTVTNDASFHLQLDIGTTKLGGPQAIIGYTP
jgi:hypothetical protein